MYYGYGFDWTYILLIIGMIVSGIASARVSSTFNKYARRGSTTGMTGAEAAQKILYSQGIMDVRIEHISGKLTDHYNPSTKTVNLSDATYGSTSVAAVGVAAHECGHVIQHHTGYAPLNIRTALVPVANIGSRAGIPIILIGMLLGANESLINIGILAFSLGVLFQIVACLHQGHRMRVHLGYRIPIVLRQTADAMGDMQLVLAHYSCPTIAQQLVVV